MLFRSGGLRRSLPWAYGAFLIGSLALIGLPGTAGAFSKDAILEAGLHTFPLAGWLLAAATLLSGLYSGRMLFGVFHGPEPGDHHDAKGHEPAVMVWPLVPLAIGALLLGYLEWPSAMLSHRLASTVAHSEPVSALSTPGMIAFEIGRAHV